MRILHLLRTLDPESGGPLTYLESVGASAGGTPVQHFAAAVFGDFPAPAGVTLAYGGSPRGRPRPLQLLGFQSWLARHASGFDALHVHGVFSWPLLLGAGIARRQGLPLLLSTHGHLYPWSLQQRRRRKRAYLALAALGWLRRSLLIATTEAERRVLLDLDQSLRVRIVAPGLVMRSDPPTRQRQSDPWLRIVFVGRIAPQKGLPTLLEALSRLKAAGCRARLDLIGSGAEDETRRLRALAERLDISDRICWHGFQQGMAKRQLMDQAHVFALSSHMENFSYATAEALAEGLAVVITREVALAEPVLRHHCGRVVAPDDPAALANALAAYDAPQVCTEEGARAYQCALAEFTLPGMGHALQEAYAAAIQQVSGRQVR